MKRRVIFALAVLLILIGIFLLVKVITEAIQPKGRGALQITSNVSASVILNNKPVGNTPLCLCENQTVEVGEHDIKIIPEDQSLAPYSVKVRVNRNVLTALDRTFLPSSLSSAYTLTLERKNDPDPELFIASIPEGALITVNGESKGVTPLSIDSISESEHEVEIQKQGFSKKTIKVRLVPSYKLVLNVILGTDAGPDENLQTTISPTGAITPTEPPLPDNSITITNTPTGFLRVRASASTASSEVGRVNPGETYQYTDETNDWYKILLSDGVEGWISKSYARPAAAE